VARIAADMTRPAESCEALPCCQSDLQPVHPPQPATHPLSSPPPLPTTPPLPATPSPQEHPSAASHSSAAGHTPGSGCSSAAGDLPLRAWIHGGSNDAVGLMGAFKHPVWDYLTPGRRPKFF